MSLLKEQNKCLQHLDGHEREDCHSNTSNPSNSSNPSTSSTLQTHQSSRNNSVPDDEEDSRGHPFTYEIIDTPLSPKWMSLRHI